MFQIALKTMRENAGLSQYQLAKMIGVSQSTIGMWESGKNKPEYSNLQKLAKVFNVPFDTLTGNSSYSSHTGNGIRIPVLGRVQAGIPIEAIQEILDEEEISEKMAAQGDFFALQIKGDSMEPRMKEGDVVIIRKQSDVDSGDIAVVLVNGDEATIKRIKKGPDGIMLISINTAYEPMFYSNKAIDDLPVVVIGKVVELRAKF